MARPDEKSNRRSKSVVRKIVSERLGDFDEQVWPVNLAILVFAGFVTGIVLAATEDFFDPRPLYNGFVRLGVVAILVGLLFVSTALLQGPAARRVQFCVILSLLLHMILAVFLREQYLKLVAFLREQAAQSTSVEDMVTIPDYVEDSFEEPGALSEYEKPEKVLPFERDSAAEIVPSLPEVPSGDEIIPQSPPEIPLPEQVAPVLLERQSLQTPERLPERQSPPKRPVERDPTPITGEANFETPVDFKPGTSREIAPQDQVVRDTSTPEVALQQKQIPGLERIPVGSLPRAAIERNPEPPLTTVIRRQPIPAQTLSTPQPEISQTPLGGRPSSRELEPANSSITQQATAAPLVKAPSPVSAGQIWTSSAPRSPASRDTAPQAGTLGQLSPPRRTLTNRPDLLNSVAKWDGSVPGNTNPGAQAASSLAIDARDSDLAPSAATFNPEATTLSSGTQVADSPSAMMAAIAEEYGMSRLGQSPGTGTGLGEGEIFGSSVDIAATQPRGIRTSGRSAGLPSVVSPEISEVGSGGPVAGRPTGGDARSSSLGDKFAVRPSSAGTDQTPLLGIQSGSGGETGTIISGEGVGIASAPTGQGIVRRSTDEALITGNLPGSPSGSPIGRGGRSGGGRLPGESLAAMASGLGGLSSPGTGGVGATQSQDGTGRAGSAQAGLAGTSQPGVEIGAAMGAGQPQLLGSRGKGDSEYLTSALLAGTLPGMSGRADRVLVGPVVASRGSSSPRTESFRQLGGLADLDPSEAFRQRNPSQRGATAAQFGGTPETEAAVEKGLAFLAKIQFPDGHWSLNRLPQPLPGDEKTFGLAEMHGDTAATAMSLLAFLGAGYTHQEPKYSDAVGRGLRWIVRNQANNGQLFRSETDSTLYTQFYGHGLGAIALCEAYGMTKDPALREPAEKAIGYILRSQSPEFGGWRYVPRKETDTSVTGWQLMALKSAQMAGLSVPGSAFEGVARWLERAQVDNGARYVYNPFAGQTSSQSHLRLPNRAMTAEGLLMRIYLGWRPDNPSLRQGAEFLRQNLPTYDANSAQSRDCYYWYYATQVMFQMQGEMWQVWNRQLQETLLKTQVQTGPWVGSWDPSQPTSDRWGKEAGRLYVTALHLLMLEVYYRHLPLFKSLTQ
ncbi:MAG: hypothetical protein ACUVQG_06470 [Thermogutta sp.]